MHVMEYALKQPTWGGRQNVSAKEITTFRAGGNIEYYFRPRGSGALLQLLTHFFETETPFYLLGRGSNVLVRDGTLRVPVVSTVSCNNILFEDCLVTTDCGALLPQLIYKSCDQCLCGLESLYGIPGTVGGAIYMNAGAYGTEVCERVHSICVLDKAERKILALTPQNAEFSYRSSSFQRREQYILGASFLLERGEKPSIVHTLKEISHTRRAKQPLQYPSAGSIFKRPAGSFAARLIEESGCKGMRVGDAQVSPLHAGFIVNLGSAKATDILHLMDQVKERVYSAFGIQLENEIEIW